MHTPATNPPALTIPSPSAPAGPAGDMKSCNKCGERKPLEAFEPANNRSAHRRKTCRNCRSTKTPAQVARIAARRQERKAELRTEEERLAHACAEELQRLAEKYPAHATGIRTTIQRVLVDGKRTKDRALEAVREALASALNRHGATAADIAEDTHIPVAEVQKILDDLCSLGTVGKRRKEVPEIARGAAIWLFFLTGKAPSTTLVLP